MDTETLVEALRKLQPGEFDWKFALFSARKSRDGVELEWNLCKMRGLPGWVDTLKTTLLEKTTAEKTVEDYSPFLSDKESIGALEKTDELIREPVSDILFGIQKGTARAPEDFTTGAAFKPTGFAFYGERKDAEGGAAEQILFMRRGNPFITGAKTRLCTTVGDEVVISEKPLLKFAPQTDFLLIGDICYFFSAAIEKDLAMENRHFAIAAKRMELIAAKGVVSDYDRLESIVMTARNARKFVGFDSKVLEHIARLSIVDREEFLSTYGVTVDLNGNMDTSEAEQCELVIDLLCCRSCLDPLGRLSVGSNITPRD